MRCFCGLKTEVVESREVSSGKAQRRNRLCERGHRTTTYEISAKAYKAAQYEITRYLARTDRNKIILENLDRALAMRAERAAGASCIELAAKYGMSVHMARYYTRQPRGKKPRGLTG